MGGDKGRTFPVASTTPSPQPGQHLTSLAPGSPTMAITCALVAEDRRLRAGRAEAVWEKAAETWVAPRSPV